MSLRAAAIQVLIFLVLPQVIGALIGVGFLAGVVALAATWVFHADPSRWVYYYLIWLFFAGIGLALLSQFAPRKRPSELDSEVQGSEGFKNFVWHVKRLGHLMGQGIYVFVITVPLVWLWCTSFDSPFVQRDIFFYDVCWYVIDLSLQALAFDIMDHLRLSVTRLAVDGSNSWFLAFTLLYRCYLAFLLVSSIIELLYLLVTGEDEAAADL